jgi:hypothetical protein
MLVHGALPFEKILEKVGLGDERSLHRQLALPSLQRHDQMP